MAAKEEPLLEIENLFGQRCQIVELAIWKLKTFVYFQCTLSRYNVFLYLKWFLSILLINQLFKFKLQFPQRPEKCLFHLFLFPSQPLTNSKMNIFVTYPLLLDIIFLLKLPKKQKCKEMVLARPSLDNILNLTLTFSYLALKRVFL